MIGYFERVWWISIWDLLPMWINILLGIVVSFIGFYRNRREGDKKDKKFKIDIVVGIITLISLGAFSSFSTLYNFPLALRLFGFASFLVFIIAFQILYMKRKIPIKEAGESIKRSIKWHGWPIFILRTLGIVIVIGAIVAFLIFIMLPPPITIPPNFFG